MALGSRATSIPTGPVLQATTSSAERKGDFMGRIRTFLLVLTAFLITSCTASTSNGAAPDTSSPTPNSPEPPISTGPAPPTPPTVTLGDADKGRTVPAAVGDRIVITLA